MKTNHKSTRHVRRTTRRRHVHRAAPFGNYLFRFTYQTQGCTILRARSDAEAARMAVRLKQASTPPLAPHLFKIKSVTRLP